MDNQQEIATPKNESFEAQQNEKRKTKTQPLWMRLFFSGALTKDTKPSKKITYIAVVAAFLAVSNLLEIKLGNTQFSFTVAASALAGVILGAVFGTVAAFLGDLVGFLFNSGGYAYMPWIGIALAVTAFLSGVIVGGINLKFKRALLVKITILSVLSFLICTVGINTTGLWLYYFSSKTSYFAYLISRLFLEGQIYNCLVNYALLYLIIPIIAKLKIVNFNY